MHMDFKSVAISLVLLLPAMPAGAQAIPQISEVGPAVCPAEIAPIEAPFEMPQLSRPVFPDRSLSIKKTGAKEGVLSTAAIQKAIDRLAAKGGGTVIVPAGSWLTGRIELKSNINLHLEDGAELHFSGFIKDYLPVVFCRTEGIEVMSLGANIYANGAENIAVTGKGKLVGPGKGCEIDIIESTQKLPVVEYRMDPDVPLSERIADGKDGHAIYRPEFIGPVNCKNVLIEGVTIEQTIYWNICPTYCENVIIRGVTVNSLGMPRGDGMDIDSSRNVLIEYCSVSTTDDGYTLKSGRYYDGIRVNKPTENVVVRWCYAFNSAGGVTFGSETAGTIRNVYAHDCVFDRVAEGIRFKTRRSRGGGGENGWYERIRIVNSKRAVSFDMLGSRMYVGELADRLPIREIGPLTPSFHDMHIKDIIVDNCREFVKCIGIPETPATNITIENAEVIGNRDIRISDAVDFIIK